MTQSAKRHHGHHRRFLLFLATAVILPFVGWAGPLEVLHAIQPEYPAELKKTGVEGEAKVRIKVDRAGKVTAVELVSATHEAFGAAAVAVLPQWTFRPATKEGATIASAAVIPLQFKLSAEEHFNVIMGREVFVDPAFITEHVYTWNTIRGKLDENGKQIGLWRAPLKYLQPVYPEALKGSGVKEEVEVEFIITPDGMPLNPEVLPCEHREFSLPALITISKMRFKPLLVDGKPVYSKQKFKFKFSE